MSTYYYTNNEVLFPKWSVPATKRAGWWLWSLLSLLILGSLAAWFFWWLPEENVRQSTVLLLVDVDGAAPGSTLDATSAGSPDVTPAGTGTPAGSGSAFFISPSGTLLTCRHVVVVDGKPVKKVQVWYSAGSSGHQLLDASVVATGASNDIGDDWAVLSVKVDRPVPYLVLSGKSEFSDEEAVKGYGYPAPDHAVTNGSGPPVTVRQGIINRVDRSADGQAERFSHSATIDPGMSGGPLVEMYQVVGLNAAAPGGKNDAPTGENYALPAYLLKHDVFDKYGPTATP